MWGNLMFAYFPRRLSIFYKMGATRLYLLGYFILCFVALHFDVSYAQGETPAHKVTMTKAPNSTNTGQEPEHHTNNTQSGTGPGTGTGDTGNPFGDLFYDKGMLRRSFYVLIGFTALAFLFIVFRWFRGKSRRKTKKYGVLATNSSDMELRPLDEEDDEEDMTVFDVNSK